MYCNKCNKENSISAKYCFYCGNELSNQHILIDKKKNKIKRKKRLLIIPLIIIFILLVALGLYYYLVPNISYKNALIYLEDKDYDNALAIFKNLDNFKDSKDYYNETLYRKAMQLMDDGNYKKAAELYDSINEYKDSKDMARDAYYNYGLKSLSDDEYDIALEIFAKLDDYKDSKNNLDKTKYLKAIDLYELHKFDDAIELLVELDDYDNAKDLKEEVIYAKENYFTYIPDLIEKSYSSARNILNMEELEFEINFYQTDALKPGYVIAVSPNVGSKVSKDLVVTLTVTRGLPKYASYEGDGNSDILYQVNVAEGINRLYKRQYPTTDVSNTIGYVKYGDIFNVYETLENETYTWYRIGYREWLVNDGDWIVVDENCNDRKDGDYEFREALIYDRKNDHIDIYESADENSQIVDIMENGNLVNIYFSFKDDSYYWYKIGPDMWIKDPYGNIVEIQ